MAADRLGGLVEGRFYPGASFEELLMIAQQSGADFFDYGEESFITETSENVLESIANLTQGLEGEGGESLDVVPGTYMKELEKLQEIADTKQTVKDTSYEFTAAVDPIEKKVKTPKKKTNIDLKYTAKDSTIALQVIQMKQDQLNDKNSKSLNSSMNLVLVQKAIDNNKPANYYTDLVDGVEKEYSQEIIADKKPQGKFSSMSQDIPYTSEFSSNSSIHETLQNSNVSNDGTYQDGLKYDLAGIDLLKKENTVKMGTMLKNNPQLNEYLASYYRIYGALPSKLQSDDPLSDSFSHMQRVDNPWDILGPTPTGMTGMTVRNRSEVVDPGDPAYLVKVSNPNLNRNNFPDSDAWHFWSDPKNNMFKSYLKQDAGFEAAVRDYEQVVEANGSSKWFSDTDDDIYMSGDVSNKQARIDKKYNNNKVISDFYGNVLKQFDILQNQYLSDHQMLVSQEDKFYSTEQTNNSTSKDVLLEYQNYISENVLLQSRADELMRYYDALAQ
mgnify:CR=1 FL=1